MDGSASSFQAAYNKLKDVLTVWSFISVLRLLTYIHFTVHRVSAALSQLELVIHNPYFSHGGRRNSKLSRRH
jgi:hypothetical protein